MTQTLSQPVLPTGPASSSPTIEFITPSLSQSIPSSQVTLSDTQGQSQTHIGTIVGGVIGGLAGLLVLLALSYFIRRRKWIQESANIRADYVAAPAEDIPPAAEVRHDRYGITGVHGVSEPWIANQQLGQ